jgi:hypothetical protein
MAAKAKAPVRSSNFWTGIGTIIVALFMIFGIHPDPALANDLSVTAQETIAAFQAKNYLALITIAGHAWNIISHLVATIKSKD